MVLPGEGSLGSHKCQISIPTVKACSVCKQEILIQEFIKHVEEKHLKKCSIKLKRLNSEDIDAGISDTKTELDSPSSTEPNTSGIKEQPRKRKAEDLDLGIKKRKLVVEDSTKGEAISISDSEDEEEEEDDDDDDDDDDDKEMRTDSATLDQRERKSLDGSFEKSRKDIKGAESSIGKQGGANNNKYLSSKPDSDWGNRWDNKNKKDH